MSTKACSTIATFLATATLLLAASPTRAATWKTGVSYGATTTMDLYVPDAPATPAPIVVSLHYCGGNAGSAHPWFQSAADKYGFIIIAPGAGGNCFDASPQRSGERANIVKMVQYVVMMNGGDAKRVYAAGASSGACMTQALLAAYPDVFSGGSSLAGVPAGAWTGGNAYGWSTSGASGGPAWGDKVRAADAGFSGTRPRVQLWQGMGDTTLTYAQTYPAEVAQWTNVFGVTDANGTKESIKPTGAQDTWARTSYKDSAGTVVVEANSGPSNVPHDLTGRGLFGDVVRFFGLDAPATGAGGASGSAGASGTAGRSGAGGGAAGANGGGSGGVQGSGGTTSSGGSIGSGGAQTTGSGGSTSSSGGNTGSAGTSGVASGSGGKPGSGGSGSGSGGNSGSGGSSTGEAGGGGCSLIANGSDPGSALATALLALLGMLVVRRQARSRARVIRDCARSALR